MQVIIRGSQTKGVVKRDPRDEAALRIRIRNGRHILDVYERMVSELGARADVIGPIDLTRNALKTYTLRKGKAYSVPAFSDAIEPELVAMIGDATSRQTIEQYEAAGGTPLPSDLSDVSQESLWNRLAANFAGTQTGWDEEGAALFVEPVTPDDLEVEYRTNSPHEPTIIRRYRQWMVKGEWKECLEVYDLTDLGDPSYRIMDGEQDRTKELTGHTYEGEGYWWRYEDGTPFHRIVISGDPREPYRNIELVEGTLKLAVLYTHWAAGVRDAGHPQRWAVGLVIDGEDSDAITSEKGMQTGPETLLHARHSDPERPGFFHQDKPGCDPEVTGKAVRNYEMGLLSSIGLPVDLEGTGGDPTEQERMALEALIGSTFNANRRHDAQVVRRLAATANRASEITEDMEPTGFDETPKGMLYLWEIDPVLAKPSKTAEPEEVEDGGTGAGREQPAEQDTEPVE